MAKKNSFTLPYGKSKGITISIPEGITVKEIHPNDVPVLDDPVSRLQEALEHPVGNVQPLESIMEGKQNIVIVVDDYTRNFPRDTVLIPFFDLLEEYSIDKKNITILIATGTHDAPDDKKLEQVLGKNILKEYNVEIHDCNAKDLVDVGKTTRGTPVQLNKVYMEADCKVLLTDVSYHYYAGFGGDRKQVLPGISGTEGIAHNHGMLVDPNARAGNLGGNPVHLDMVEAAGMARPDFVVNVIAHGTDLVDVKAGELGVAFSEAARSYNDMFEVQVEQQADMAIVSAGGYPKDINLYQGTKGLTHAIQSVKKNGQIVYLAECSEGIGHAVYEEWIEDASKHVAKTKDFEKRLDKAFTYLSDKIQKNFVMGGHKAWYMLRERKWAKIALLSGLDPKTINEKYFFDAIEATTPKATEKAVQAFIDKAIDETSPGLVYIIPHGGEILVTHANKVRHERIRISNIKKAVKIGPPYITKYEKSRIVGARALQIALGAPPLVDDLLIPEGCTEPIDIADVELSELVLPIIIRRVLPSKAYEDYPIELFEGDAASITKDVTMA